MSAALVIYIERVLGAYALVLQPIEPLQTRTRGSMKCFPFLLLGSSFPTRQTVYRQEGVRTTTIQTHSTEICLCSTNFWLRPLNISEVGPLF